MEIKIGKRIISISNPEKILFPKKGSFAAVSKQELIAYYQAIAPTLLPHIKNRPLTMQRFPDGISKEGFYQKDASDFFPSWIEQQPVKKEGGGVVNYVVAQEQATIVYLANLACITPHIWLSRVDNLNKPDRMIFDLDPSSGVTFETVRWAAFALKELLKDYGPSAFVMTTGSRGLHIVVPIKRAYTFEEVSSVAHGIAQILVDQYPKKLTLEVRKAKRGKRVFIDVLRNAWSATTVAPYSVRAYPGAPVAMPISWKQLEKITNSQEFTIANVVKQVKKYGDMWEDIGEHAVTMTRLRAPFPYNT